jgi:hypothetical protein
MVQEAMRRYRRSCAVAALLCLVALAVGVLVERTAVRRVALLFSAAFFLLTAYRGTLWRVLATAPAYREHPASRTPRRPEETRSDDGDVSAAASDAQPVRQED